MHRIFFPLIVVACVVSLGFGVATLTGCIGVDEDGLTVGPLASAKRVTDVEDSVANEQKERQEADTGIRDLFGKSEAEVAQAKADAEARDKAERDALAKRQEDSRAADLSPLELIALIVGGGGAGGAALTRLLRGPATKKVGVLVHGEATPAPPKTG